MSSTPPKIDIYITQRYTGNFSNGKGDYAIVLETIIAREPKTITHCYAYQETTNHRLAIHSCISALRHIKKGSEITFHLSSTYVAGIINSEKLYAWERQQWKKDGSIIKNAELWKKYKKLSELHLITAILEKENAYSEAMLIQLELHKTNYVTDYREENIYV